MPFGIFALPTSLETLGHSTMADPNRLFRKGDLPTFGAHCAPEKNRPGASGSRRAVPQPRAAIRCEPIRQRAPQILVWGAQPVRAEHSGATPVAGAICPGRIAA